MARYYDIDRLRVSDINVGTVMFPKMERCILIKDIESAPTADVVERSELKKIFEELEVLMLDGAIGNKYPAKVINPDKYAELRKKYVKE